MGKSAYDSIPAGAVALLLLFPSGAGGSEEEEVFHPGPVHRLRISLSEEAIASLGSDHRAYVRGTVVEGGKTYLDVGVRVKGSLGSLRRIHDKPGLTLKFNQFVPRQRFHGLKKILLNNCVQDSTYFSELIGNELFRAAGVPAQRVGFAAVELNGRKLGFYTVLEAVTEDFLARWFKDPTGNLYEGPPDINSDRLDVDSRDGASDRADLRDLMEAAREPDLKLRMERLEKVLDVERFISFTAVEAILAHWDGYTQGRNNYHLYHDPTTGLMVFIPHGTDQLFQNVNAPLMIPANGLVARAVLKTAAGRRRFRERVKGLMESVFNVDEIQRRITELEAKVRPFLRAQGAGDLFSHAMTARNLSFRIGERARSLREQLAGEGQGSAPSGTPLAFGNDGKARLSGWQPRRMGGSPEFERTRGEGEKGGPALRIGAGQGGDCRASFRVKVFLAPGRYQLAGKIRTEGVEPAARSVIDGAPSGANVRISGDQPRLKLLGTRGWTRYDYEFEIEAEEEWEGDQPVYQVELICELQASKGVAWFDESSLELTRAPTVEEPF